MGSALWFFDPNYNFNNVQGRWLNYEMFDTGWCFYDTSFLGFYFPNNNLDEYELGGVNIGTQIKTKIQNINFGTNGEIGTPQTTVLTKNDLNEPSFIPIDLGGLSTQGFNYLKGKAGVEEDPDDAAKSAYYKAGGQMPWSYLDPKQKEYWRNKVGKGSDSLESQPEVLGDPNVSSSYYSPEDKKNVINYYKKIQANPNYQPKPYERESLIRQMRAQGDGTKIATTNISTAFPPFPPDKEPVDPPPTPPSEPPAPPKPNPYPDEKANPAGLDARALKLGYNDPYYLSLIHI